MSTNSEAFFVANAKSKMSKEKTLEDNIRTAFQEVKDHWSLTRYHIPKQEFDIAMLVVSSFYGIGSLEIAKIKQELAYVMGVCHTPFEPIGIIKIWKEIRNESGTIRS